MSCNKKKYYEKIGKLSLIFFNRYIYIYIYKHTNTQSIVLSTTYKKVIVVVLRIPFE